MDFLTLSRIQFGTTNAVPYNDPPLSIGSGIRPVIACIGVPVVIVCTVGIHRIFYRKMKPDCISC